MTAVHLSLTFSPKNTSSSGALYGNRCPITHWWILLWELCYDFDGDFLLQWAHIYFFKNSSFSPNGKKTFFVFWGVGKKTSTQCIWHLENKYYKDVATAFSSKLGSLVYIKCFNTHIVSGGQFHPQWGKMLFLGVKNKTKPLLFMYKTQIKHIVVVHRTHKQIYSTVVVYNSLGRRNGD